MATTMIPPTPAAMAPTGEVRFVAVRASLLPDEVISSRQAVVVRKQVLLGLVGVVIALIGWYGMSWWQTKAANSDLSSVRGQGVSLQNQQNQFAPLVRAQAEISAIQTQLQSLMATDLQWKTMLATLRAKAPSGVSLRSVSGTLNAPTASLGGLTGSTAGIAGVGQVTITGTAPDKKTVAAYADQLATVSGLSAPLIENVQATTHPVTFTISALITSDALGGRYSATTTGGH